MDELIRRYVVRFRPSAPAAAAVGVGFAILGALFRLAFDPLVHGEVPYISFFPMLLMASLLAGSVAGAACLAASTLIALLFLIPPFALTSPAPSAAVFVALGAMIVYVAGALRRALVRLTEAAQQERTFTLELQHRVKNTLAIVQSVATQTARTAPSLPDFRRDFSDRLIALAAAHNVLSEAGWRSVSLRSVAERVLSPFGHAERVGLDGPDVWLIADQAVNFALSLHELVSNACKHGALSEGDGRANLSWRREDDGRIVVEWREMGGPRVGSPRAPGFGLRLLTRGTGDSLTWRPTLEFRPEGLAWQVVFDDQAVGGPRPERVMKIPGRRGA